MIQFTPYLIDWLTLRVPVDARLGEALYARLLACRNMIHCYSQEGEVLWSKPSLDVDALRSDTPGLVWMVQSDGKREYLAVGGSPASIEHGLNVFGGCDIYHAAQVLIRQASIALKAVLPPPCKWQCRRIDITGNFALPDAASVKQALRQLCLADGGRRKATNQARGGDSVYWNPTSDLAKGKAYHKGPQLAYLARKGVVDVPDDLIALSDRLLRLEHTRGARWFRRLEEAGHDWWELKTSELEALFVDFFGRVVDGVEVRDMDRYELVNRIAQSNGITDKQAEAAFATYRNIRADGFEVTRDYIPRRTWCRHLKLLRGAGISDADLQQGNLVQFRPVRVVLAQPVMSWDDIRRAA